MKFHHIGISVRDLEKSIKFYKDNFGFKEINRFSKEEWDGEAAVLELDGFILEIFGFNDYIKGKDDTSNLKVTGLNHFAFRVDGVDEKYKELKEKGIDISKPQKGTTIIKYCFLRDPDNISIELYEEK
jgi:catechol 2,3-dioxygenase-like lactoylglutathione lyase family enzyme|tara:strand:- start:122 stop:505 length:384 start_codon:yes stop_codon:yes gene_type:complete